MSLTAAAVLVLLCARPGLSVVGSVASAGPWTETVRALALPDRTKPDQPETDQSVPDQTEPDRAWSGGTAGPGRHAALSRAVTRPPVPSAELTQQAAERQRVLAAQAEQVTAEAERLDEAARQAAREREDAKERAARSAGYDPEVTDPRQMARQMADRRYGWSGSEWECIDQLITQESSWDPRAVNPSSGAYGLVQSLPAEKMASVADDWRTNPATQLEWGLDYIAQSYGTPCQAWSFHLANNWY